jgi:hypothetical protein
MTSARSTESKPVAFDGGAAREIRENWGAPAAETDHSALPAGPAAAGAVQNGLKNTFQPNAPAQAKIRSRILGGAQTLTDD